MSSPKRFVYIIKNGTTPPQYYAGLTANVSARLVAHNEGRCVHTPNGRPWQVDVVVEFADGPRAVAFERYLKTGSGWSLHQLAVLSRS